MSLDLVVLSQRLTRPAPIVEALEAGDLRVRRVARNAEELGDLDAGEPDVVVQLCSTAPAEGRRELLATRRWLETALTVAVVPSGAAEVAKAVLGAGVEGLVYRDEARGALVSAVRAVVAGQVVLPRSEYRRAVPVILSRREREVLRLAVEGLTNDMIGARLFLSRSTVKGHLTTAFAKLSVRSRAEAASLLLDPEHPAGQQVFGALKVAGREWIAEQPAEEVLL